VIDFTSSCYLGLRHDTATLRPWARLTTGRPAALQEDSAAGPLAADLASLMGFESAVIAPSTLHLAWDLFGILARDGPRRAIIVDGTTYPITRWGVDRAAALGATVHETPPHDVEAVHDVLERLARRPAGVQPLILTDGLDPSTGRVAPLAEYAALAASHGGLLVLDDTQALGVVGARPTTAQPYGTGGGGACRWAAALPGPIICLASLAKGLGVPMAILAGAARTVAAFRRRSETRIHCSPPSAATLAAGEHAVACNRSDGDARRAALLHAVRRLHARLVALEIEPPASLFPIQSLPMPADRALAVQQSLAADGITVAVTGRMGRPALTVILTARHRDDEIDRLADALARALGRGRRRARATAARTAHARAS